MTIIIGTIKKLKNFLIICRIFKIHRSKEDVLARLKADNRLQNDKQKKTEVNGLPAFVAVAALLVLSIIASSMLQWSNERQVG